MRGNLSGGGVGSSQIVFLARRTRTMKLCSSDARSKGQSGYSSKGWMELKSCLGEGLLCSCNAQSGKTLVGHVQ